MKCFPSFLLLLAGTALLQANESATLSGGRTTVFHTGKDAFSQALANITRENRRKFAVGNSFFTENWLVAPASPEARDGLGPLFIARSCSACHVRDGKGAPPADAYGELTGLLVRLSRSDKQEGDPIYGKQLAVRAIPGAKPEATARVRWDEVPGSFADGEKYLLRRPVLLLSEWNYGPPDKGMVSSLRLAPSVFGGGLLEAIPAESLQQMADETDKNGDGISGRTNLVWSSAWNKEMPGRFGWKANVATLKDQTANAFVEDIGISSSIRPNENHTAAQAALISEPASGGSPEISDRIAEQVTRYLQTLAPPARRGVDEADVIKGEAFFKSLNCAACHVPEWTTGKNGEVPELGEQIIRPYTDLLLHDMGPDLDDARPDFLATGREWRTPPLWGLGLNRVVNGNDCYLHDGRARSAQEAILWHGGEAEKSRDAFKSLTKSERAQLLKFLDSL